MRKILKLLLGSVAGLFFLTGCLFSPTKSSGASTDNLDGEVIISQLKEQLKKNMNKLGFEVNVDDYSYKVKASPQTFATSGSVLMSDKRYEDMGYFPVYSGELGSKKSNKTIQLEKVSNEPLSFVAAGYANYIVENIFTNETYGINVNSVKQLTKGEVLPFALDYHHVYENQVEEVYNPEFSLNQLHINDTTFLNSTIKIKNEDYLQFFRGKKSKDFDYNALRIKMGYVANVGIYVDITDNELDKLKKEIKNFYNKEILVVTVTNYKRK